MDTGSPPSSRRRGERVMIRIPVKIYAVAKDGEHINESAETAVVSRYGALVRVSAPVKYGSTMEVTNSFTGEIEKFRVAWLGDAPKEGKYEVGIEFLAPRDDFWGVRFPQAPPKR